jgi:PAS domain S-box-containing protein
MNPDHSPEWLHTTMSAVRELMVKRIDADSPDAPARRDMQLALDAFDLMWEELRGQAALLVRENRRYAEFFEFAPDAYLITDIGGTIREANQASLELLKSARDDVVGKPLSEYVSEEDRVAFLTRTVGLMASATPAPLSWQARLRTHEGVAAAQFRVRPIALKRGGASGLCWLIRA